MSDEFRAGFAKLEALMPAIAPEMKLVLSERLREIKESGTIYHTHQRTTQDADGSIWVDIVPSKDFLDFVDMVAAA